MSQLRSRDREGAVRTSFFSNLLAPKENHCHADAWGKTLAWFNTYLRPAKG
jgi:hypothetical protein